MPYYVYAIRKDSRRNDFCGCFVDYQGAEICERDHQKGKDVKDQDLVMMIYAENKTHALQRLRQIRREKGLPTN